MHIVLEPWGEIQSIDVATMQSHSTWHMQIIRYRTGVAENADRQGEGLA